MKEFEEIFESYKKIKEDYANTIFNSRLILFGMNRDGTPLEEIYSSDTDNSPSTSNSQDSSQALDAGNPSPTSDKSPSPGSDKFQLDNSSSSPNGTKNIVKEKDSDNNNPKTRTHSKSVHKENTGAEVVFYPDTDGIIDLEERLRELIISLFFVLEGKRLDRSFERTEKLQLLCAPFEKRDLQGIDTDSKSFKRKCQGRLRKHLADLCLQADRPGEAILHYQTSLDILKTVNDSLWIGACYEGLCSSSVILTYPQTGSPLLKRNLSFCVRRGKSKIDDNKVRPSVTVPIKRSYSNGCDVIDSPPKPCLDPDDIIEKYKESIMQYSKCKAAAVIEMEASIKACRVLVLQRKYLQASDFLQNVVYISLQSSDEDKIQRYSTLASLYSQIGFHRKAAFFRRVSALQCVNPQVTQPSWYQCYSLLLQALDGYGVTLDPREFSTDTPCGWPVLQMRVLQELIFSARKMGNPQLSVRHMTFLLHTMLEHLSPQEKRDVANVLSSYTARCEGTPQPLATDSGIIFPPVPLTKLPLVKSFQLMSVAGHCRPVKLPGSGDSLNSEFEQQGLFIYTPFSFGETDGEENKSNKVDFCWVAGDVCEVHLEVHNPMPDELNVSQMGLLTDGIEMDVFPANATIPAESGPHLIKLSGIPKTTGDLNIYGYISHVYGVRSHCKLKDIPHLRNSQHIVEVIPALPQIQVTTSLPKASNCPLQTPDGTDIITSATTVLYAGQSLNWILTINNIGNQKLELLDLGLTSKPEYRGALKKIVMWNEDGITTQLPVQPEDSICIPISLYGYNHFYSDADNSEGSAYISSYSTSVANKYNTNSRKTLEVTLTLCYSGGPGLEESYCRQCAISLRVEIFPTISVQKWDVIPAGSYDRCFVLFDLMNQSGHQTEVQYNDGGKIIIEASQCRRIAIPFTRCHLPKQDENLSLPSANNRLQSADHLKCPVIIEPLDVWKMYLSNCIDVRWSASAVNATGKVSLENVVWSSFQLNLMKLSPIKWTVVVNSQYFDIANIPQVAVGELTNIHIMLVNTDSVDAHQAEVSISCYQDLGSGTSWMEADEQCSFIGLKSLKVDKLVQGGSLSHECHLLFHHSGIYKFDIQCAYHRPSPNDFNADASSPPGGPNNIESQLVGETSTRCQQRTVWKCTPVMHIKVLESALSHLPYNIVENK